MLEDLNKVIASVEDLHALAQEAKENTRPTDHSAEQERLQGSLERVRRLRKSAYEDYKDDLISKEDYLRYKDDYQGQEDVIMAQLERLQAQEDTPKESPWVEELLKLGKLTELDRATVAETIKEILVYEDHVEITYNFSDDLGFWTNQDAPKL